MRKGTVIILIIVLVLVGVSVGWYLLKPEAPSSDQDEVSLFPDRSGSTSNRPRNPFVGASDPTNKLGLQIDPVLQKVTDRVVAGGIVFASSTAVGTSTVTEHVVRFVERGTGHIYESKIGGDGETRISNTTIRQTREAFFGGSGESVLIQYEEESGENIQSFVATLPPKNGELDGDFLPNNIFSPSISPNGDRLVYALSRNGQGEVVLYDINTKTNSVIFSSPIKKWLVSWADDNAVLIQTPPSRFANGFAYLLSLDSDRLTKVAGDLSGLSTIYSPESNSAIFSASTQNETPATLITQDRETTSLGISTIVLEKCSLVPQSPFVVCGAPTNSPAGDYPDDWLLGKISFADILWKVNTNTGQVEIVTDPLEEVETTLDVVSPTVSQDGSFMVFVNKKDLSLWLVKLK